MVILARLMQPEKAEPSILVTELGMVTLVRLVHFRKTEPSILVTELGMVILARLVQLSYLQPVITQYFVRNKSEICHRPLRVHSKG